MACVPAPIIGGASTPTRRNDASAPPNLYTSIGFSYHTLNREEHRQGAVVNVYKCASY